MGSRFGDRGWSVTCVSGVVRPGIYRSAIVAQHQSATIIQICQFLVSFFLAEFTIGSTKTTSGVITGHFASAKIDFVFGYQCTLYFVVCSISHT